MKAREWCATLASLVLLATGAPAVFASGNTCDPQDPPWGKELTEPDEVFPANGVLDTTLVVRKRETCVPVWSSFLCGERGAPSATYTRCFEPGSTQFPCSAEAPCSKARRCVGTDKVCSNNGDCRPKCNDGVCAETGAQCSEDKDCYIGTGACDKMWGWDQPELRTYGFPANPAKPIDPADPDDPNIKWGLPGPTLLARAELLKDPTRAESPDNPAVAPGTRVKVALHNYLEPQDYDRRKDCDPAGPDYTPKYPECFHGPEITNLHYHGTHVSPQPHQDYVLLELWPHGSKGVPESPDTDTPKVGKYQTDINPLPWNQAPGTHWYHPHKHGSTALQVLNGMSGALLIDGPFDDWLKELYGGELVDRLLIVQQVAQELKYFEKQNDQSRKDWRRFLDNPPQALVNGLATPQIAMRPGEIQRFRFVGATMQASAALEIGFDQRIREVFQIAQDGIQFAWQNYERQPYRDSAGTYVNFDLTPGNRADFLIRAPMTPGTYLIEHNVEMKLHETVRELHRTAQSLADRVPPNLDELEALVGDISERLKEGNKPPIDPSSGTPLLFTIEVRGEPKPMQFPVTRKTDPACAGPQPPKRCWPRTPAYLEDLPAPDTKQRYVAFSMKGEAGEPPEFFINKTQYAHSCVGAAMSLGSTEDWEVANVKYDSDEDDLLAHPFHIHINPFQVVRDADRTFEPPYVWQDTIALPVADGVVIGRPAGPIWNNEDAQKKCPDACAADNSVWTGHWRTTEWARMSECDCVTESDSVLLRQRFDDYTGAYVLHCHFLGHEDRGMMWNVQTVCDPKTPWRFGEPQKDGSADSCAQTSRALVCCPDELGNKENCGPR